MATHSSILAWEIPWAEKPGRLQSMGHKELDMTEQLTIHFFSQGPTLMKTHVCLRRVVILRMTIDFG